MTDRITVGEEEDKTNGSLTSTPVEMHDARPLHASTITEDKVNLTKIAPYVTATSTNPIPDPNSNQQNQG